MRLVLLVLLLAACGTAPPLPVAPVVPAAPMPTAAIAPLPAAAPSARERGREVVLYALGLIDTGYRYGGKNPSAGLDCSGMVSHVYAEAVGFKLRGSAADIARLGRPVEPAQMQPGDLVFFNTSNRRHSHVGIYIGDDRFVHAPKANGRVRTASLKQRYFASRFEEARSYFN